MRRLGLASTLVVLPDCQHGLTDKVCFFDWMLLVEVEVVLEVVVVEVVMVAMLTIIIITLLPGCTGGASVDQSRPLHVRTRRNLDHDV